MMERVEILHDADFTDLSPEDRSVYIEHLHQQQTELKMYTEEMERLDRIWS